jgi:RHS repeat-associated protein
MITPTGTITYTYDRANRLTNVTDGTNNYHYSYNGAGLRVASIQNSTATSYTWDVAGDIPEVITDTNSLYLYGLDLIAQQAGSDVSYYHADALGSVRNLTNSTGQVVGGYSYDAFGAIRSSSGSVDNDYRFAGEQQDDTGLIYLRARYYDPTTGRFLSVDPKPGDPRSPQSRNPYTYVENRPTMLIDPEGTAGFPKPDAYQREWWEGFIGIGIIATAAVTGYAVGLGVQALIAALAADSGAVQRVLQGGEQAAERSGYIEPNLVRFSQNSISYQFTEGGTLRDAIDALKAGVIRAEDIPAIRVFMRGGKLYTLDNRRLYVFQQAGIKIKYVWASAEEVAKESWKFHPVDDGLSIRVRGGG